MNRRKSIDPRAALLFAALLPAVGVLPVALQPEVAFASDASDANESCSLDAASDACADAAPSAQDASTVVNPHCTATGNPCTTTEECCGGLYCGAFNATSGSDVCGADAPNTIPTGSCNTGPASPASGLELVGLLGLAIGTYRRRRST